MKRKYFYVFCVFALTFLYIPKAFAFTLSQNLITVEIGHTAYITSSASTNISLGNTNSAIATVSLSGGQLTIQGVASGQSTITVCVTNEGCQNVTITVPTVPSSSASTIANKPVFSGGSSITMTQGQSQIVTVSGSGSFLLSSNSNPEVAGASVSGTSIYLMGNNPGGTNLTVCDQGNNCSVLYVTVQKSTVVSTTAPTLVSFAINFFNNQNNFLGVGSSFQLSFSTNVHIASAGVAVGNSRYAASGSGNGPYTLSYGINGSEPKPLPIVVSVSDSSNNTASFPFVLGANGVPVSSAPVVSNTSTQTSSNDNYVFSNPIVPGMQNADVLALQKRLAKEGVYTGPQTGYFGSLTEAAVKKYQAKHGITQLGIVGPGTRAALNSGN